MLIKTSHHTHYVIGSGANDPQKYDPEASRETLDHSIPYIFTVALQDGSWHHERSYAPERAAGAPTPSTCGTRSRTVEDPEWTRRYHSLDSPRRPSAAPWRSRSRTARSSPTRSRSPTPTRWAPGRSPGSSTSTSSAPSPRAWCADEEIDRFLRVARALPELGADLAGLTVLPTADLLGLATPVGIFDR